MDTKNRDNDGAAVTSLGADTATYAEGAADARRSVCRFRISIVEGPATGTTWQSATDRCSIGSHHRNDLIVDDPTVSRFHCEILVGDDGVRIRDLKSRNRTVLDGVVVFDALLRVGSLIRLGKTVLRFELSTETNRLPLSEETRFGSLSGVSPVMRAVFAMLSRAATSDATVLFQGETGTGKTQAAHSVHAKGARSEGPFVVVDCGALPGNLLESELFGHEKGSFTGATDRRIGAFEEASGGTLFLDEIGELPIELQPKLLRALEAREVRRIGSNTYRPINVRVIAATNRDLRGDVNSGRFRADLYFRIAVLTIPMPPLRQRPEDIPALTEQVVASLHASKEDAEQLRSPEFLAQLRHATWPGNVRELRNCIERYLILRTMDEVSGDAGNATDGFVVDPSAPYTSERERIMAAFERRYFEGLLRLHGGKVGAAATASGMDRAYLYRLLRRRGIAAS